MTRSFDKFCEIMLDKFSQQADRAVAFIWFHIKSNADEFASIKHISDYFIQAELPAPNKSRLSKALKARKDVASVKGGAFRLHRSKREELDDLFLISEGEGADVAPSWEDIGIGKTPFLTSEDFENAREMSNLYVALYCLENSMRKLIESVLRKELGEEWWDKVATSRMKNKHNTRLENEKSARWIPARSGFGPLYALDWPDLISIMRKREDLFIPYIGEVGFLHRYEDLGRLRNIIAHNGVLSDSKQSDRVRLAFHDWVEQLAS